MAFEVGEIVAKLTADIDSLKAGINQAKSSLDDLGNAVQTKQKTLLEFGRDLGKSFMDIGNTITKTITLPLVGVGAATAKVGMSFEDTMQKIVALTGTSQEQVNQWAEQIKKLAPELGKSPQELAEALYFIASAGVDASKAMDVLVSAAKASAAGLGDTQVIADALTSAVNAYAKSGLTAEQATAILLNTVELGKAEADALAGSIGRVIPVAAQLGVGFEEVGAAIASMTRTGLSADEAVTALRGVLTTLLQPTAQEREALEALGLSAEGLRQQLSKEGILSVLNTLSREFERAPSVISAMQKKYSELEEEVAAAQERFEKAKAIYGENSEEAKRAKEELKELEKALKKQGTDLEKITGLLEDGVGGFFGNVRALVGALSLMGENAESVKEVFSEMSKTSVEDLDSAFNAVAQTTQFSLNQAIASTKAALLELAEVVLPPLRDILVSVADTIKTVAEWFNGLDEGTKKTALTIATVFAVGGPALMAIGGMINTVVSLVETFQSLEALIASSGPIGIALAALAAAIVAYQTNFLGFRDAVNYVIDSLKQYPDVIGDLVSATGVAMENLKMEWEAKWNKFKQDVSNTWENFKKSFQEKIDVVLDFASNAKGAVKAWWDNVVKDVGAFLSKQNISKTLNIVLSFYTDALTKIALWWSGILLQIMEFIDKNTPAVIKQALGLDFSIKIKEIKTERYKNIAQEIKNTLGDSIEKELSQKVGTDWLAKLRAKVKKDLPSTVKEITSYFRSLKIEVSEETAETVAKLLMEYKKLYDELVGHSIIPDLVVAIKNNFEQLKSFTLKETEATTKGIIGYWTRASGEVGVAIGEIARKEAELNAKEEKRQRELKEKREEFLGYSLEAGEAFLRKVAEGFEDIGGAFSLLGNYLERLRVRFEQIGNSIRITIINWKEALMDLALEGIERVANALTKLISGKFGVEWTKWGESNLESFEEMVKNFEEWEENQKKLIELQQKQAGATIGGAILGGLIGAIFGPLGALIGAGIGGIIGEAIGKTLDEQVEELKKKLENTFQKIKEFLGTTAGDVAGALSKAFDSQTYTEFVKNFANYLREMVKDALIKAFLAGETMKPILDRISDLITTALLDANLTAEELAAIEAAVGEATEAAQPFFELLQKLFRGVGEAQVVGGGGVAGTQIAEITGPTKDLLVSLLGPLGNLGSYITSITDILKEIRDILRGWVIPMYAPTLEISKGSSGVMIENLYVQADIKDISTWEAFMRMVSEKARIAVRARGLS